MPLLFVIWWTAPFKRKMISITFQIRTSRFKNKILSFSYIYLVFLVAKLLFNSLCLSVRNAMGEMCFSRLLFRIKGWNFLSTFHHYGGWLSIKHPWRSDCLLVVFWLFLYFSHFPPYLCSDFQFILCFTFYGCCHPCLKVNLFLFKNLYVCALVTDSSE